MISRRRDDAVSDIIAFVLIMFLIVTAVACWMLVVIPGQGSEAENAHDEKVLLEFTDFKKGLDLLWLNNKTGYSNSHLISLSPSERTSLSTLLYLAPTLGTGELIVEKGTEIQLWDTHRYFTETGVEKTPMAVIRGETYKSQSYTDSYSYNDLEYDKDNDDPYSFNLMRITYISDNEYAPDFTVVYEGGAVWFKSENGGSYQLLTPAVDVDEIDKKNYHLIVVTPDTSERPSKILGNMPVALKYTYTGQFFVKENLISLPGKPTLRTYLELYSDSSDSDYTYAVNKNRTADSDIDTITEEYWKNVLGTASSYPSNEKGASISLHYYTVEIQGGSA